MKHCGRALCALMLALVFLFAGCTGNETPAGTDTEKETTEETEMNTEKQPTEQTETAKIGKEDFIVASGAQFINRATGKPVTLVGFNVGGWLCHTVYMTPITGEGIVDDTTLYAKLDERFGVEKRNELFNAYFENYMTEFDFEQIALTGANSIRLPFWWRNFMNEDGTFILNEKGEPDFSLLDNCVEICRKYGLYVILELHGAPGSQNGMHASGLQTDSPTYFARTEEGERNRQWTRNLWVAIAEHFADEPVIAGYDLLGEPYWTGTILKDNRWWIWTEYNELYKAIRKVDPTHVLYFESSWNAVDLPDPALICEWKDTVWENVAYSAHYYPNYANSDLNDKEKITTTFNNRLNADLASTRIWGVPLYIGETNWYFDWEMWDDALFCLEDEGVSYSVWAYKCPANDTNQWGTIWRGNAPKLNPNFATYKEAVAVWSKQTEESMNKNPDGIRMLCKHWGGNVTDFRIKPAPVGRG